MEKTLVLAKPDALQRGLVGEIITRLERKGLKLIGIKMIRVDDKLLDVHYSHHSDKAFFVDLKKFMQSSPIVAMAWEGLEGAETVRQLVGATNARKALPGTIRGDLGMSGSSNNIIHSSDSTQSGAKEVALFFKPFELMEYDKSEYVHIYAQDEF